VCRVLAVRNECYPLRQGLADRPRLQWPCSCACV
jgi:hypothetical protein